MKEKCISSNSQLDVQRKLMQYYEGIHDSNVLCKNTDYSRLTGQWHRYGKCFWTRSTDCNPYFDATRSCISMNVVGYEGKTPQKVTLCDIGIRPAISYSSISSLDIEEVELLPGLISSVLFGEYPQYCFQDLEYDSWLEKKKFDMALTGKNYTYDARLGINEERTDATFVPKKVPELFYDGKKLVRFEMDSSEQLKKEFKEKWDRDGIPVLSNGVIIKPGNAYWILVDKVEWWKDVEQDIVFSRNSLLSGIPYHNIPNIGREFKKTFIKQYLDYYFAKEILPSKSAQEVSTSQVDIEQNRISLDNISNQVLQDILLQKNPIETNVLSLALGKAVSTKEVAKVLNIEEKEVLQIVQLGLIEYKDRMNQILTECNNKLQRQLKF